MTPERMAALHSAAFAGDGRAWPASEIAAFLARPAIHAVALGEIGFALVQIVPPEAELLTIAIDPAHQGRGHGGALLAAAQDAAAGAGATELFLEVGAANTVARQLYGSAGFAETGRRSAYYTRPDGTREDALLLRLALPAGNPGPASKT